MKRKGAAMEIDSPIVLSSGEEEEEDYYFSEDDECITYDGDSDNDFSMDVGVASSSSQVNYAVLNEGMGPLPHLACSPHASGRSPLPQPPSASVFTFI